VSNVWPDTDHQDPLNRKVSLTKFQARRSALLCEPQFDAPSVRNHQLDRTRSQSCLTDHDRMHGALG
jgi:hypothetical protein